MQVDMNPDPEAVARLERIVALAKEQHEIEGKCEIDDNATVSEGSDNGAYVQAWVWVSFEDTELSKSENDEEENEDATDPTVSA